MDEDKEKKQNTEQNTVEAGFKSAAKKFYAGYSKKDYAKLILEDKKIRDLISEKISEAGLKETRIERL